MHNRKSGHGGDKHKERAVLVGESGRNPGCVVILGIIRPKTMVENRLLLHRLDELSRCGAVVYDGLHDRGGPFPPGAGVKIMVIARFGPSHEADDGIVVSGIAHLIEEWVRLDREFP